jgi:hypothetical protein
MVNRAVVAAVGVPNNSNFSSDFAAAVGVPANSRFSSNLMIINKLRVY